MSFFKQPSLVENVDGHSAIAIAPIYPAGEGIIFSAIIPLHPTIQKVWCPPDLTINANKTLIVLANPGATGLNPVVRSIVTPVEEAFIAKMLLLRDGCLAKEHGVSIDDKYFQLDLFVSAFESLDGTCSLSEDKHLKTPTLNEA